MPRELVSKRARSTLAVLLLSSGLLAARATAGNPVTVQLHGGLSNPIYVDAGTVTINFSALLVYGGAREPWNGEAANVLVYNTSGDSLATLPIPNAIEIYNYRGRSGTVTWNNPVAQYIQIGGNIYINGDDGPGGSVPFFWFYLPGGRSVASGGDILAPPTGGVTTQQQPPQTTSLPANPGQTNIHAVIISGLADPAKVIASPNVTMTGGLVALGKPNAAGGTTSTWSSGFRFFPDYGLLMGTKIPPVTPNIIDVRIVRQQVQADLPSPGQLLAIKPGASLPPSAIRRPAGEFVATRRYPRQIPQVLNEPALRGKRRWAIAPGIFFIVFQLALRNSVFS